MNIKVGNGIAVVALGDTLLTLWREPATPERVSWLTTQLNDFAYTQPSDILHCMLILPSSSPPGSQARALFQKQVIDLDAKKKLRKFIVIALGDSFWNNIVRAVGRTILLLAGKSDLLNLLGNLKDGFTSVRANAKPTTPDEAQLNASAQALAKALDVPLTDARK